MTQQEALADRVTRKARAIVGAGGVTELGPMAYRIGSLSKPGTWHDVYLKWAEGTTPATTTGLRASCRWFEPVTGSQNHCADNGAMACWHVLAAIITKAEMAGRRVAFFSSQKVAERYSRFGGCPMPIIGRGVWFVANGEPRKEND